MSFRRLLATNLGRSRLSGPYIRSMSTPAEKITFSPASPQGAQASVPPVSCEVEARPSSARPVKVIRPPSFSLNTIVSGIRTLAQHSDLLLTLSAFRLKVRYKQSALGWAWAALQPLGLMVIYTIIFTRVTKVATGGTPYPIFVFSGLLPWIFFSSSISNAVNGLVLHHHLLTKMYFPREIIPLSYLVAGLADFSIAALILRALMARYDMHLTWNILYALPIVLVLAGFAGSVALFLSALQVRFRDVGLAMPFMLQVWMFTTPVVYSLHAVPARFRTLYLADPIAGLIDNFRTVVIYGSSPDLSTFSISAAATLVCLLLAYGFFKASEATMADVI